MYKKELTTAALLCEMAAEILTNESRKNKETVDAVFRALNIKDKDFEKIDDAKIYGMTLDLASDAETADELTKDIEQLAQEIRSKLIR